MPSVATNASLHVAFVVDARARHTAGRRTSWGSMQGFAAVEWVDRFNHRCPSEPS